MRSHESDHTVEQEDHQWLHKSRDRRHGKILRRLRRLQSEKEPLLTCQNERGRHSVSKHRRLQTVTDNRSRGCDCSQLAVTEVAPKTNPDGANWQPGNSPSQVLDWLIECLAKAGTLSIGGVYPASMRSFPIGDAMEKNLTIRMGNCNHRKHLPELVRLVQQGSVEPKKILTQVEPLMSAIDAYKVFDLRQPGRIKVELQPQQALSRGA